jgi:NADPH:quinone reductase-like Zn-dependent oxidoreductase
MKAVRFHEHGAVEVLRYEEAPDPVAGPGEVVVAVKACALNYLDIWERRGLPGVKLPLPHISGADIAGDVASVGPGVAGIQSGMKTLLYPAVSCMQCEFCYAGRETSCRKYSVLGYFVDGGYAEYVKVPACNVLPFPDPLDYTAAAALPLVLVTAWHMLVERCRLKPGEDVLVLGAGSGVGSIAIQIARLIGARVIATAGTDAKLDKARALGASHVIDHSRQSVREEVKRLTGKRGVDVVFEHVGAATWDDSVASLAPNGRLVTCGATTGHEVRLDLRHLFAKQLALLGSYMGSKAELIEALKHVRAGHLTPVVSNVLPLEQAGAAQTIVERREHFGKVVLKV